MEELNRLVGDLPPAGKMEALEEQSNALEFIS
jgi:hypothetical protein